MTADPQIPAFLIDSYYYGRKTLAFWNIIYYNIISPLGGPELYGTEPAHFYLANLLLNFNILVPLALLSLPGLLITLRFDKKRLGRHQRDAKPDESSAYTLLAMRLAPFYLWVAVFTLQAHKEERFMYSAYPLLCMNAAVGLYLVKGWVEQAYIIYTKSPYKVSLFLAPFITGKGTDRSGLADSALLQPYSPCRPPHLGPLPRTHQRPIPLLPRPYRHGIPLPDLHRPHHPLHTRLHCRSARHCPRAGRSHQARMGHDGPVRPRTPRHALLCGRVVQVP